MQYLFTVPIAISLLGCALLLDLPPQPGRDALLILALASATCMTGVFFAPFTALFRNGALVTLLFVGAVFALPHVTIQWLPLLRLSVTLYLLIVAALAVLLLFPGRTERARQFVVIGLASLFALPIWLGPIAEAAGNPVWLTNLIVAASPLSALAAALDLDVLRTNWFYQHSVLGSLRYEYFAWFGYMAVLGLFCIGANRGQRPLPQMLVKRRGSGVPPRSHSNSRPEAAPTSGLDAPPTDAPPTI